MVLSRGRRGKPRMGEDAGGSRWLVSWLLLVGDSGLGGDGGGGGCFLENMEEKNMRDHAHKFGMDFPYG